MKKSYNILGFNVIVILLAVFQQGKANGNCNQTFTSDTGVISVTPGDTAYCQWNFTLQSKQALELQLIESSRCVHFQWQNTIYHHRGSIKSGVYIRETLPCETTEGKYYSPFNLGYYEELEQVHFMRNNSQQSFLIQYRIVNKTDFCGSEILTATTGKFASPFFESSKSLRFHRLTCIWEFFMPEGRLVEISIDKVKGQSFCVNAQFTSLNYIAINRFRNDTICATPMTRVLNSTTNTLIVELSLSREETLDNQGFSASYKAIRPRGASNPYTDCGGVITANSGFITSPGYPNNYPTKLWCHWILKPEMVRERPSFFAKHQFTIKVYNFTLEDEDCNKDYLLIGYSRTKHCGEEISLKYGRLYQIFNAKTLNISFYSDDGVAKNGFRIYFSAWEPRKRIKCGKVLTDPSGNFSTPGFPRPYMNGITCTYEFPVNPAYSVLRVNFHTFDIEPHPSCRYDNVDVRKGRYAGLMIPGWTECGNRPRRFEVSTTGEPTKITLRADETGRFGGFFATYTYFRNESMFTGKKGKVRSLNYPQNFPIDTRHFFKIQVPRNRVVSIKFLEFDITSPTYDYCPRDHIEIFEGKQMHFLGRYCYQGSVPDFTSTSNEVTIVVTADDSSRSQSDNFKFLLEYKAVKTDPDRNVDCGVEIRTSSKGEITSPGFPNNYSPGTNCDWIIKPGNRFSYIHATLWEFDLEEKFSDEDCLDWFNGTFFEEKTCGVESTPKHLLTSARSIGFSFVSNLLTEKKGFRVTYNTTFLDCGKAVRKDEMGTIESANPDNFLSANFSCTIKIIVPKGKVVDLHFHTIRNEILINVTDTKKKNLAVITSGYRLNPRGIKSSGNQMQITYAYFKEDVRSDAFFNATYRAVDKSVLECGGTLRDPSGTIQSRNDGNHVPANLTCVWKIIVAPDKVVELNIEKMSGRYASPHLEVFDGSQDKLLARLANAYRISVVSTTNVMIVKFSNKYLAFRDYGVNASYVAIDPAGEQCGGRLEGNSGSIQTPNRGFYPANFSCVWEIIVPNGMIVEFKFDVFNVGSRDLDVLVFDGTETQGKEFSECFCHDKYPEVVRSTGNVLTIKIENEYPEVTRDFFNATYKAVDLAIVPPKQEPCFQELTSDSGSISFGSPHNTVCTWIITVAKDHYIDFKFTALDLECYDDVVELTYKGQNRPRRFCRFRSSSNEELALHFRLNVTFVSDSSVNGTGFSATYSTIPFRSYITDEMKSLEDAYGQFTRSWRFRVRTLKQEVQPTTDNFLTIIRLDPSVSTEKLFFMLLAHYQPLSEAATIVYDSYRNPFQTIASISESVGKLPELLVLLTNQDVYFPGTLLAKAPKNQQLVQLHSELRNAFVETPVIVKEMSKLMINIIAVESGKRKRFFKPFMALQRVVNAAIAVAEEVKAILDYMRKEKKTNKILTKFCNTKQKGPACFVEKMETLETREDIFLNILQSRILSSQMRVWQSDRLLDNTAVVGTKMENLAAMKEMALAVLQ